VVRKKETIESFSSRLSSTPPLAGFFIVNR